MSNQLDDNFWSTRYKENTTGWDLGQVSPPIEAYVDQLTNKDISILIPGCGNSHEAEHLLSAGFKKVTLVDISEVLVERLKVKFEAEIAEDRCEVIHADFFDLKGTFDLVIEQTFFCAIDPSLRQQYAQKMAELLKPGGKVAGVLFEMHKPDGPPFGGNSEEYLGYFEPLFDIKSMEPCHNSIAPRAGSELFIILQKK
ncbi:methyltransferase domain-containing protein [Jiulongibacter sediminis]|uniref:SAM-dependent methyltransferase n=1 Tax=Jiulongibacter sediminis TaxID=1605367 RepID=A0A0P7BKN1_9BACT|nr:methyltransferase domain-containing protein [Jiulongibacter sediminis]KPM47822.1 SAM-dependent methyltransferase [Jiulongibacter sediminis]TBX24006.1 SAM-dependent methlyltransferase [Jiulongibacter sediminis]